jgi:hypothetical protein
LAHKEHFYYNEGWQVVEVRKDEAPDPLTRCAWHPYYIDAIAVRWYDKNANGISEDHDGEYYYCQDANFNVTSILRELGHIL